MRVSKAMPGRFAVTAGALLGLVASTAFPHPCVLDELQKLTASDASESDQFGSSVSISGDRLVVGAWRAAHEDIASGAAYVFRRDDQGTPQDPSDDLWLQEDKLIALDAASGDLFGWAASISGDRAIVGARFHSHPIRAGSAFVFRRDENGTPQDPADDFWVQEAELTASDAASGDDFGTSVSISGDRAVVGASKDDDACPGNPDCNSGSAYVFRRDDNGTPLDPADDFWVEEDKLRASDNAEGDLFGISVSISGDRCVVGAWLADDVGVDSGSAYVFRRDDNGTPLDPSDDFWVEEDKLTASDAATHDAFGVSVSISGDRSIVGAWLDDDAGNLSGSAYVFRRDDNGTPLDPSDDYWVEEDKLTASDGAAGDEFGKSVSIQGDRAAVGAFEDDDACDADPDPNCDSGSAYVFRRYDNGTPSDPGDDFWVETAKLTASDTLPSDFFGRVAVSGDRVVVGSLDDAKGENAGSAYVFDLAPGCANLEDFAGFQNCVAGEGGGVLPDCHVFDFDGDADVDLVDYDQFVRTFSGP